MSTLSSRGLCPFCTAITIRPLAYSRTVLRSRWSLTPQTRSTQSLRQKPRPSRMSLSPKVASNASRSSTPKASRQPKSSPFGAMNRTDPGPVLRREVQRRAAITRNPIPTGTTAQRKKGKVERAAGDMKALRMRATLATVPYAHRTQVKAGIGEKEIKHFDAFSLREDVRLGLDEVLEGMKDVVPTPIQRLAVPALLGYGDHKGRRKASIITKKEPKKMQQFLLAAETGSGKTLAYALPIINALKESEAAEVTAEAQSKPQQPTARRNEYELDPPPLSTESAAHLAKPRAIILLPSAELVAQVGAIFKTLSYSAKQRVAVVSAAQSAKVIRSRLFTQKIDIVVSTPALLASIAESTPAILSSVCHLVVDEADSLFDRSFAPLTSSIIDRATPSLSQLILCSATIPRSLDGYLRARFPDITRLATPNLHAIPRRVQLTVQDIEQDPYRGNRQLACADAIWTIGRSSDAGIDKIAGTKLILVFVNERANAEPLADYLRSKGIDAAALTRDTGSASSRSADILGAFTSRARGDPAAPPPADVGPVVAEGGRTLPNVRVLIATDLASRGLDTLAVRTVVLYDVPHSSIDFVHRLGRTGRMGRRGRGIVLVGEGDQRDVVREVREGMFMGRALI